MNEILIGYLSLFLSAFGAATLLPLQSEALLLALLFSEKYVVTLLLAIATFGNVLGACVNWWLGIKIETYRDRKVVSDLQAKARSSSKVIRQIWLADFTAQLVTDHW